ncbi:MAG: hypothetical protein LCH85_22195 [Chloroflexi bacterium]|nr:hypothetical protein [Chloroflexota bacterium]
MADVPVTAQQVNRTGVTPAGTTTNNTDTYYIPNDGHVILQAKNAGGSPVTITVESTAVVDVLAVADYTISIPATTGDKVFGPFIPAVYNDSQGRLKVTTTAAVSLFAFRV